jgi:heat shock protein beta
VTKDPRGDTLGRGTRVTLHLKDDAAEYVEQEKIRNLVKKYSEFINYPIKLYLSKEVREQVEVEDEPEEKKDDADKEDKEEGEEKDDQAEEKKDDIEVTDEGEKEASEPKEKKTKTVSKTVWEWEKLNEIKAIWMREKTDITEREYQDFYKTITKDSTDPLAYTHFSAEGEIEFKAILYIPKAAPYDLFEHYYGRSSALKLYVRRVLITEEFEDLMPKYLNFVKGVVDSDDLPLNVSREQLQQMKMVKVMSKKLVRKAIEMVRSMAEEEEEDDDDEYDEDAEEKKEGEEKDSEDKDDDKEKDDESKDKKDAAKEEDDSEDKYGTFWQHFGKNIKLGVIEDASNRNKLAKLLRFYSTHDTEALTNLDEYISRMKPDQDTILYLPGDSKEAILKSPILKKYQKKGYEVLLMADPIDEFCTQHLSEYEKRKVKSIAKDDVSLIDQGDEQAKKKL